MIILSLNEMEQLCQKAARGAGLDWGLAEEAAMAAVWLAKKGIDGPKWLCHRLQQTGLGAPMLPWGAQDRVQCPIALGATLCDYARLAQGQLTETALGPVSSPILLLPFLSHMSAIQGHSIDMTFDGCTVQVDGVGYTCATDFADITPSACVFITQAGTQGRKHRRFEPMSSQTETIKTLEQFMMRTHVPASAVSRAGAGAVSDDD
jgi:hypothetical protein